MTHFYDHEKGRTVFGQLTCTKVERAGPPEELEEGEAAALYRALEKACDALASYGDAGGKLVKRTLAEINEIMKDAVTPLPSAESADRETAGGASPMNSSAEGNSQQVSEKELNEARERIAALEKELRQEAHRLAQSQKGNQRLSDENKRLAARVVEHGIRVRRMQEYFNARVAKHETIERLQKELARQAQKTERLKRLIKQAIQEGDE